MNHRNTDTETPHVENEPRHHIYRQQGDDLINTISFFFFSFLPNYDSMCVAYTSQRLIIKRRRTGWRMFRSSLEKQTFQLKINMDSEISCWRCVCVCCKIKTRWICQAGVSHKAMAVFLLWLDLMWAESFSVWRRSTCCFYTWRETEGKTFHFCHFGMEMNEFKETACHFVRKVLSLTFLAYDLMFF